MAMRAGEIKIAVAMAIANAGATGHFLMPGAPAEDIIPTKTPIKINLPDGSKIQSTQTCHLAILELPQEARQAHIVPGLAHTSLISIKALCDQGCKVTYDEEECNIYNNNKTIWTGMREPITGLWIFL